MCCCDDDQSSQAIVMNRNIIITGRTLSQHYVLENWKLFHVVWRPRISILIWFKNIFFFMYHVDRCSIHCYVYTYQIGSQIPISRQRTANLWKDQQFSPKLMIQALDTAPLLSVGDIAYLRCILFLAVWCMLIHLVFISFAVRFATPRAFIWIVMFSQIFFFFSFVTVLENLLLMISIFFSTSSVKSWISLVSKFFPLFLTLLPLISSFILFLTPILAELLIARNYQSRRQEVNKLLHHGEISKVNKGLISVLYFNATLTNNGLMML